MCVCVCKRHGGCNIADICETIVLTQHTAPQTPDDGIIDAHNYAEYTFFFLVCMRPNAHCTQCDNSSLTVLCTVAKHPTLHHMHATHPARAVTFILLTYYVVEVKRAKQNGISTACGFVVDHCAYRETNRVFGLARNPFRMEIYTGGISHNCTPNCRDASAN